MHCYSMYCRVCHSSLLAPDAVLLSQSKNGANSNRGVSISDVRAALALNTEHTRVEHIGMSIDFAV